MLTISLAAALIAVGIYLFVMWVAGKHSLLGLAVFIASTALVTHPALVVLEGHEYDCFFLTLYLTLVACAVAGLIRRRAQTRR